MLVSCNVMFGRYTFTGLLQQTKTYHRRLGKMICLTYAVVRCCHSRGGSFNRPKKPTHCSSNTFTLCLHLYSFRHQSLSTCKLNTNVYRSIPLYHYSLLQYFMAPWHPGSITFSEHELQQCIAIHKPVTIQTLNYVHARLYCLFESGFFKSVVLPVYVKLFVLILAR